jgi:hypothetical protein
LAQLHRSILHKDHNVGNALWIVQVLEFLICECDQYFIFDFQVYPTPRIALFVRSLVRWSQNFSRIIDIS